VGKDDLCRACFDGVYPVELPLKERLGKNVLEDAHRGAAARTDIDGLATATVGAGAADALTRP
jgi:amidophosphoribosyltransferase